MVKKIIVGVIFVSFISNCFAGFSSGGRSGFSSGRSSFSSRSFSSRSYSAPKQYSYAKSYSSPTRTVINNHHYSSGGFGIGHGFFSGLLGGYIGSSLANNHNTTIVNSAPLAANGVPVVDQDNAYLATNNSGSSLTGVIVFWLSIISIVAVWLFIFRNECVHRKNRW